MKKILTILFALCCCFSAKAFVFDGINLNDSFGQVARSISLKGYYQDPETGMLKGKCQGTDIYLMLDGHNVTESGKLGTLTIEVPMDDKNALQTASMMLNVIYHQVACENGVYTYVADPDGTTIRLSATKSGIRLVYVTPYVKK